ncbi:MAG: hypothetical protein MJZ49_01575 [Bacteroidales bacterium]|nr:hypothetical protein [Bacteroidales bacterium]
MNKTILTFIICLCIAPMLLIAQNDGNGGGAVRISFGNDNYVEPVTLSGDDPTIPPKPKRVFHTNSLILNQILAECEDFEALTKLLDELEKTSKITLSDSSSCEDCFLIVNNSETKIVVAVLDKGKGKRMNLLNNQFETETMYEGDAFEKRWFSLSE